MKGRFNAGHFTAGFTAILVGYTSSVIIVIQAATSVGANQAQTESWLLALGVAMGLSSILFSWVYKMPVLMAWSTPGAALLAGTAGMYDLSAATGAFIISGLLIVITGLVSPLSRALRSIPLPLGTAMLGAILLPFCLKAFETVSTGPEIFFPMFASFLLAKRLVPRFAMVVLLAVGVLCSVWSGAFEHSQGIQLAMATPVWTTPEFDGMTVINLAVPLYIITMLSQNLPGVAMMKSYHYEPPVKPVLMGTGLINILLAPWGGFSLNLAAISAAICMNDEVDPDKGQRYRAVIWAGVFYLIAGCFASGVVAVFLALPKEVAQILAGLALSGTLIMCLYTAFSKTGYKEPAMFTFLITLSGVSWLGISATLWGLMAGLVSLWILRKPEITSEVNTSPAADD